MTEEQMGWKIFETFYPHVGVEELVHGDFALVREVTGMTADAFIDGKDLTGAETGWIAVAFAHGNPGLSRSKVAQIIGDLKVADVQQVGFEAEPDKEAGAGPPDGGETRSPDSSVITDGSSSEISSQPPAREITTQP